MENKMIHLMRSLYHLLQSDDIEKSTLQHLISEIERLYFQWTNAKNGDFLSFQSSIHSFQKQLSNRIDELQLKLSKPEMTLLDSQEQIQKMYREMHSFWELHRFHYVHDFFANWSGFIEAVLGFMPRQNENCDDISFLSERGYIFDGQSKYLLDCDVNKEKIHLSLTSHFPSLFILSWETRSNRTLSEQILWKIKVLIKSPIELKK